MKIFIIIKIYIYIVLFKNSNLDELYNVLVTCDIIIYDITTCMEEALYIAESMQIYNYIIFNTL